MRPTNRREFTSHVDYHYNSHEQGYDMREACRALEDDRVCQLNGSREAGRRHSGGAHERGRGPYERT